MRLRLTPVFALAAALASVGCGDHLLPDDEPESMPVCMMLMGTLGYWDDGGKQIVWDAANERTASICTCMTQEELESHELHDDLNDLMLIECQQLSTLMDFDWDECIEDHASGTWMGTTFRSKPGDYWHPIVPDDLNCE